MKHHEKSENRCALYLAMLHAGYPAYFCEHYAEKHDIPSTMQYCNYQIDNEDQKNIAL